MYIYIFNYSYLYLLYFNSNLKLKTMAKIKNYHLTALPTYPIQDNLGQVLMQVGFSKIEMASVLIAGHIYQTSKGEVLPETIAQESIELAKAILDQCEEMLVEDSKNVSPAPKIIQ
jgi:NifU-like protein involved in Fe-S cluster formation